MRIAVVGSGQLGGQLTNSPPTDHQVIDFSYPEIDITNPETFTKIAEANPEVIINCAAYTNVDGAETDHQTAKAINTDGPANLSELSKKLGIKIVHVSTDYVFAGSAHQPYLETDATAPINYYGQTKLDGDLAVEKSGAEYLIVRTAWLYGQKGPNFVLTMLKLGHEKPELKAVTDQIGSPTFTKDLAEAIISLIENNQQGLFNFVNDGSVNRIDWVKEIFRLAKIDIPLKPALSSEFPTAAKRPAYSVLSTEKIRKFYQPRPWTTALADYLSELGELRAKS